MDDPVGERALEPLFTRVLRAFDLEPDAPRAGSTLASALARWGQRVSEWNQRIDLTAARSDDELVDLLVADAAAIARALRHRNSETWVDVGSGAGAPGLALSLLAPELTMTLVEPKAKRVAFLRSTVGELGCDHVRVQRVRSDELGGQSFEVAVSRATLAPAEWLAEGARLARRAVWVLLAQAETPAHPNLRLTEELSYRWPLTGAVRRALRYEPLEASGNVGDPA
jgi:16S rRNA (guanine527-N7)-methyltransferase